MLLHTLFKLPPQWGSVTGHDGGAETKYSYPIAFPQAVFTVATNKNTKGGWGSTQGNSAGIELIDKSSFYAYADDGTQTVNYIAIGY